MLFGSKPGLARWILLGRGMGTLIPALALIVSTASVLIMQFNANARRKSPLNYHLLALFTLGESVLVGLASSVYQFRTVLLAMAATASAATGISLYTVYQKNPAYDLTQWGAGLAS